MRKTPSINLTVRCCPKKLAELHQFLTRGLEQPPSGLSSLARLSLELLHEILKKQGKLALLPNQTEAIKYLMKTGLINPKQNTASILTALAEEAASAEMPADDAPSVIDEDEVRRTVEKFYENRG